MKIKNIPVLCVFIILCNRAYNLLKNIIIHNAVPTNSQNFVMMKVIEDTQVPVMIQLKYVV